MSFGFHPLERIKISISRSCSRTLYITYLEFDIKQVQ